MVSTNASSFSLDRLISSLGLSACAGGTPDEGHSSSNIAAIPSDVAFGKLKDCKSHRKM